MVDDLVGMISYVAVVVVMVGFGYPAVELRVLATVGRWHWSVIDEGSVEPGAVVDAAAGGGGVSFGLHRGGRKGPSRLPLARRWRRRRVPGHVDCRRPCQRPTAAAVVGHFECHLHVVGGAMTAHSPVEVVVAGSGDEVVVFARLELHAARSGCERPKGDGEVHQLVRFVADGNDARVLASDPASLVLLFGHAVNDVLLHVLGGRTNNCGGGRILGGWLLLLLSVDRTDDVDLVVFPRLVAPVDVDDVVSVIDPEDGVGRVPVDKVRLANGFDATRQQQ